MPEPDTEMEVAQEIFQETIYNIQALGKFVDDNEPRLVNDQKHAYNTITESIENDRGGLICVFFIFPHSEYIFTYLK